VTRLLFLVWACGVGCGDADKVSGPDTGPSTTEDAPSDTGAPDDSAAPMGDDTGEPEPVDPYPECGSVGGGTGQAVGTPACTDGRCFVAEGSFWMGSEEENACPVRAVELSAYWIDQTEVTHGQWSSCVAAGSCEAAPEHCRYLLEDQDPAQQPVTCIDWDAASAYCEWNGGRLPTEAEWEKAARGTEQAEWAWGPASPSCLLANYRFSPTYCFEGLIEVGYFADISSPFGLYDTVGNAWEWVSDWYDPRYYRVAPNTNPPGPDCEEGDPYDNGACRARVIRGGAFNTTKLTTRAHARSFADPAVADDDMGFRCAYAE
jgi:formylglycine-generating enzyme required for sulfatase activity